MTGGLLSLLLLPCESSVSAKENPDRKKRTNRIKVNYSSVLDLLIGVPQDCILGPLLFNICICDLFFFMEEETGDYLC